MTKIWKVKDVMARLDWSRAKVDRNLAKSWAGKNDFPLPFSRKGAQLQWTVSAIEEWIERRQSAQSPVDALTSQQTKKEYRNRQERAAKGLARHGLGRNQNEKEET